MTNPTPPYQTCVNLFLESIKDKPLTLRGYTTGCRMFGEFVGEGWPTTLDKEVLVNYRKWLASKKPSGKRNKNAKSISGQSVKTYVASAKALLNFLNEKEFMPEGVSLEVISGRIKSSLKKNAIPYPKRHADSRVPLVIKYYDDMELPNADTTRNRELRLIVLRNRAIVHVLYSTGGRIGEVASLTRNSVNDGLADKTEITGKRDKKRKIYFNPASRKAIVAYLKERTDDDEALFVGHRKKGKLGTSAIWTVVKDAAKANKIDVRPHDFRHYLASQMLDENAPLEMIQEILGHSDISTTRRIYAEYSEKVVKEAFYTYHLPPDEAIKKAMEEGKE